MAQVAFEKENRRMITVELRDDEINLLLTSVGVMLNVESSDATARRQLEALQSKLMGARDAAVSQHR